MPSQTDPRAVVLWDSYNICCRDPSLRHSILGRLTRCASGTPQEPVTIGATRRPVFTNRKRRIPAVTGKGPVRATDDACSGRRVSGRSRPAVSGRCVRVRRRREPGAGRGGGGGGPGASGRGGARHGGVCGDGGRGAAGRPGPVWRRGARGPVRADRRVGGRAPRPAGGGTDAAAGACVDRVWSAGAAADGL